MSGRLRRWAGNLRRDTTALYFAARDPRTPWYARAIGIATAAYALSPIDLIPDFILVIGQLDDLIIVPLGIWLTLKLIPAEVMAEHRRAADEAVGKPVSYIVTAMIIVAWLLAAILTGWLALRLWKLLMKL